MITQHGPIDFTVNSLVAVSRESVGSGGSSVEISASFDQCSVFTDTCSAYLHTI